MVENEKPNANLLNFLEIHDTKKANEIDLCNYRLERYSKTKDAFLFVKRRYIIEIEDDKKSNFLEVSDTEYANKNVDLEVYRLEQFSEIRSAWIFVKRRISKED